MSSLFLLLQRLSQVVDQTLDDHSILRIQALFRQYILQISQALFPFQEMRSPSHTFTRHLFIPNRIS